MAKFDVRRHLLHAVLRGALMTQLWVGVDKRATKDIDFLALFPRDMQETSRRLTSVLAAPLDDDVAFYLDGMRSEVIWQETAFAGHRYLVPWRIAEEEDELQIDVGFGDPLVPAAEWIEYPSPWAPAARVQAVRPELLVAWKMHGLFEHGVKRWQGKDLNDLLLLTQHCQLDVATLAEAIRVAFAAHGDAVEAIPVLLDDRAWWQSEAARRKWTNFRAASRVAVPEDLLETATAVANAFRPVFQHLP